MPLAQVCNHLHFFEAQLANLNIGEAYKLSRIRENLRLDCPRMRDHTSAQFIDAKPYPDQYPPDRGPNVPTPREELFIEQLQKDFYKLEEIAQKAVGISNPDDIFLVSERYVKQLEDVWGQDGKSTVSDACNSRNCQTPAKLPAKLFRYVSLYAFVRYTLLPNYKTAAGDSMSIHEMNEFVVQLAQETRPGVAWNALSNIWKMTKADITGGGSLYLRPRYSKGEVCFVGDGNAPLHKTPQRGSTSMLEYIVRTLALPGWEAERHEKLGLVAIEAESAAHVCYRPTILDNLGSSAYFFVPALPNADNGLTWPLTPCFSFNDPNNFNGMPEWTVLTSPDGIRCFREDNGKREATFELAGISLTNEHAALLMA